MPAKPLGGEYLQVAVGMQFQCRIEQLVGLLQSAAASPKYLTVLRLMMQPAGGNEKLVGVTMQVAGIMRNPSETSPADEDRQ